MLYCHSERSEESRARCFASAQHDNAPLGVYAVLGNHDHWAGDQQIAQILREHGVKVPTNRAVCLRKGSCEIWLVGIDDLWSGKPDW